MPQTEIETIPGIARIGDFCFDWIPFPNLNGFFRRPNNLDYFNCVRSRYGVYFFFDSSRKVQYVGCTTKQNLRKRISQYIKHELDSGNSFAKTWIEANHPYADRTSAESYLEHQKQKYRCYFKTYIEEIQLGTLSICIERDETISDVLKAAICNMENFFIHELKPIYNGGYKIHGRGMTSVDRNELRSQLLECHVPTPGSLQQRLVSNTDG